MEPAPGNLRGKFRCLCILLQLGTNRAAREHMLDSTLEIDHFHLGGRSRINPDDPPPGRRGRRNAFVGRCHLRLNG
ncbi:hypothetical protein BTE77_35575 [Ensifer adhaerens]|nr:hypothetical protein BTE77_35575 [Ensifer adhaerens]